MTWVACKLNNFTKNEYIAYIIGKSLEGILIYISKFLTDFRVCFHGAISSQVKSDKHCNGFLDHCTTDALPTLTGPVPVHRSRNEDEGDDEDQEQSNHSDQYHASDTGDENLNGLEDSSEQYSENIDELESKGEDASKDGGERVNHRRPKKHKVSRMKHGAKGKASIPKDEDEDTDEDDIEETFERLNRHKPGKQVGTKQHKVNGKKSDKGKGAEGKGTKGKGTKHQSTKGKVGPPTHHPTRIKHGLPFL